MTSIFRDKKKSKLKPLLLVLMLIGGGATLVVMMNPDKVSALDSFKAIKLGTEKELTLNIADLTTQAETPTKYR